MDARIFIFGAAALLSSTVASAQIAMEAPDAAPGYSAIMSADFARAERDIRGADVSKYDPARLINLGVVLAKTGRREAAERSFKKVLMQDDVQLILFNGETANSHDVALRALASLHNGVLSR
jgi:hypothetical protein